MEVGILTAAGQLPHASEFRFDIHREDGVHEYITVKRGRADLADLWAIAAGESADNRFFDQGSDCWSFEIRGADAYVWELEPALLKAQDLSLCAQRERERIQRRRAARETNAAD